MITVHINARDHEEAHVASAKFTLPAADLAHAEREVARQLAVTVRWAEEKDMPAGAADAEIGVTVIVFGGELEDAEDRLEGLSAAVVGQFGDWCVYDHECEHHHHDHEHSHEHHDHDHHHHEHGEDEHCR